LEDHHLHRPATTFVLACLVLAVVLGVGEGADFRGDPYDPPKAAPDLTLKTPDGKTFRLRDQRDRVVALSFGYTFCPDVCPTTLAELVQVRARLGTDADRLRIVFITADPERDTPARLQEYAGAFTHRFTPLTGPPEQLAQGRKAYGVVAEKRVVPGTTAAYLIDHSALVYVIDPQGRLRLTFPFGLSIDDMTHDIKLLLRREK
jgi:protein SCO1/2